jgi:hypothetical protein
MCATSLRATEHAESTRGRMTVPMCAYRARAWQNARVSEDRFDLWLIGALIEQADFLRQSAAAFNSGRFAEAKRLAVAVRILCHDTGRSHSLLGQLGLLDELRFVDATPRRSEHDDLPQDVDGLVYVTIFSSPLAPMSGGPLGFSPVTSLDGTASRPKPFAEWWDATIVQTHQVAMSRREVGWLSQTGMGVRTSMRVGPVRPT